jgi:hypothetical protein
MRLLSIAAATRRSTCDGLLRPDDLALDVLTTAIRRGQGAHHHAGPITDASLVRKASVRSGARYCEPARL